MTDEVMMAKIDALIVDLEGFIAIRYAGDPKAILYLARTLDMNIMFDSMQEMAMEASESGRENNGE